MIKDAFVESFQLQLSVLHQSMCIFKASLSGLRDDWVKYKEKVPDSDFSIPTKMLKQHATLNSSL